MDRLKPVVDKAAVRSADNQRRTIGKQQQNQYDSRYQRDGIFSVYNQLNQGYIGGQEKNRHSHKYE
jgi:hypothetical protein